MVKKVCHLLSFLLFIFLLFGCGAVQEEKPAEGNPPSGDMEPLEKKTTVVIAEDGAASGAGFYIAKEKGYFDDYNIDIRFTSFANSDDMLPALAAGEVDIARWCINSFLLQCHRPGH